MLAYNDSLQNGDVDDLKVAILRNDAASELITSDDPAIFTNRWLMQRGKADTFGIGSAGLAVFLPMGPRVCFLMYDAAVYTVGTPKFLNIDKVSDINAINAFQIQNASENIYFSSDSNVSVVLELLKQLSQFRRNQRYDLNFAIYESSLDTHHRFEVKPDGEAAKSDDVVFHSRQLHVHPQAWPSFLRYRRNAHGFARGRLMLRIAAARKSEYSFAEYQKST